MKKYKLKNIFFSAIIAVLGILICLFVMWQYAETDRKWIKDYQQIIRNGKDDQYILYDINGDETPELIYDNCIYYYNSKNELQFKTDINYWCTGSNQPPIITANGVMCLSGGSASRWITIYTMVENEIESKLIMKGIKNGLGPSPFQWYKVSEKEEIPITFDESKMIQSQYGTEKLYFISTDIPVREATNVH